MKKSSVLIIALYLALPVKGQWVLQGLGWELPGMHAFRVEALNENVVWTSTWNQYLGSWLMNYSRTNDGGIHWQAGNVTGYRRIHRICPLNYDTAWFIVWDSLSWPYVINTQDGGLSWQVKHPCAAGGDRPGMIHFWNDNEGLCIGMAPFEGHFDIFTTVDGGQTWNKVDTANIPPNKPYEQINGNFSVVNNVIWEMTQQNRILKSTDRGYHWSIDTIQMEYDVASLVIYFRDSLHGVIIDKNHLYETFNGGSTWSLVSNMPIVYSPGFSWVPGTNNTCISSGSLNAVYSCAYSFDGGHTWSDFDTLLGKYFYNTSWVNSSTGWVGSVTDSTNPSQTGIWKFTGTLLDIVKIDPRVGGIKLFPNPTKGPINLLTVGFEGKDIGISLYTLIGQKVFEKQYHQNLIQIQEKLDLSALARGAYVAAVRCGGRLYREKVVVQ